MDDKWEVVLFANGDIREAGTWGAGGTLADAVQAAVQAVRLDGSLLVGELPVVVEAVAHRNPVWVDVEGKEWDTEILTSDESTWYTVVIRENHHEVTELEDPLNPDVALVIDQFACALDTDLEDIESLLSIARSYSRYPDELAKALGTGGPWNTMLARVVELARADNDRTSAVAADRKEAGTWLAQVGRPDLGACLERGDHAAEKLPSLTQVLRERNAAQRRVEVLEARAAVADRMEAAVDELRIVGETPVDAIIRLVADLQEITPEARWALLGRVERAETSQRTLRDRVTELLQLAQKRWDVHRERVDALMLQHDKDLAWSVMEAWCDGLQTGNPTMPLTRARSYWARANNSTRTRLLEKIGATLTEVEQHLQGTSP